MHTAYVVLVVAHVLCAVVGFGTLAVGGVYGFTGRAAASEGRGREEVARWFASPTPSRWLLLAVPFLGIAALSVEPHGAGPGQLWAEVAIAVWAVAAGTWWYASRPAEAALAGAVAAAGGRPAFVADGPAEPARWSAACRRVGVSAAVTDLAFAVGLVLMILQPR